jgi:hypothetical protein
LPRTGVRLRPSHSAGAPAQPRHRPDAARAASSCWRRFDPRPNMFWIVRRQAIR